MQGKDYQKQQKLFHNRMRIMWISYKYSQVSSLIKKRRFQIDSRSLSRNTHY